MILTPRVPANTGGVANDFTNTHSKKMFRKKVAACMWVGVWVSVQFFFFFNLLQCVII